MARVFSQNGWEAFATPKKGNFVRFQAAGQGWWAADDDVATIFTEFIERFDREVEEITQKTLDDWSYANRLVRGSTTVVSNHGSATAVDINALKHPRGVHNTFSKDKAAKVRAIKDAITDDKGRPVLRLGMDFQSTIDDMHVEINANKARVKQAAAKIRAAKEELGMDAATLKSTVKAALNDWADDRTIENTPLQKGDPKVADWTLKGWAAAQDRKADQSKVDVGKVQEDVDKLTARVAELTASNNDLLQMMTELLARVPAQK